MADDAVRSPVRDEVLVQLVTLAAGVISVAVMVAVQRGQADPDFWRTWRMRASKRAERCWARLAGWSWRQAERERVAYERERA